MPQQRSRPAVSERLSLRSTSQACVITRDNDGDGALVAERLAMRYPRLGIPIRVILEQYGGVGIGARAHDAEDAGELGHAPDFDG